MSLFEDLHQEGSTIIVVTHDRDVAKRAERCVALHDGHIIEDSCKQPVVLRSIPGGLNESSG
jgi:ABC-type lipoprotein export system ATPase subunit